MSQFSKSVVEQVALAWLESTGWSVRNGVTIAPGELPDGNAKLIMRRRN